MQERGFTLIELLIAITLLAIITVMAYSGLNSILKSHEILSKQAQSFDDLSHTLHQIQQDIRQIVPRPIHNSYDALLPALNLQAGTNNVQLSFTRAGIPNPTGLPRSSLQRIEYIFANKTLTKRTWLSVDNNNIADFNDEILLTNLNQFKVQVLGYDNNWYPLWPDRQAAADILPKAVQFLFNTEQTGDLIRLLELPL